MNGLPIHIHRAKCGYGTVAIDKMGFACPETDNKPLILRPIDYAHAICAHAPSELEIEVLEPLQFAAATNASFNAKRPVQAWIGWHMIGELNGSSQVTPWIDVPPGRYVLRLQCATHFVAHTLWLARPSPRPARGRVAVVTNGYYPLEDLPKSLRRLFRSAANRGLLLFVNGVGRRYISHSRAKIVELRAFLRNIPESCATVLYTDGNDALLLGGEQEIVDRLAEFSASVVVAGEDACWPVRTAEWASAFLEPFPFDGSVRGPFFLENGLAIHPFINAGGFAGERRAVGDTLAKLEELFVEMRAGRCSKEITLGHARPRNDQYVWQAAYRAGMLDAEIDIYWKLFACPSCSHRRATDNPYFIIRRNDHAVSFETAAGGRPVVLHWPGPGKRLLHLWDGLCE